MVSNRTPYLFITLVVKFDEVILLSADESKKITVDEWETVDPDQMPCAGASDQGLHYLLMPICPNT